MKFTPEKEDYMRTAEARKLLRVSPTKMAQLLADGSLPHFIDPLDRRVKLVRRADVEALRARKPKAA
jgi:hypothetical protein